MWILLNSMVFRRNGNRQQEEWGMEVASFGKFKQDNIEKQYWKPCQWNVFIFLSGNFHKVPTNTF